MPATPPDATVPAPKSRARGVRLEVIGPQHADQIDAFNERMTTGGSTQHLSLEPSFSRIARTADSPIRIESLALLMGDDIRGGVNIKSMPFRVAGATREIAFYNRPLSEGIVDPKFALVGTMIHKLVSRRHPEIYGLGVGSRNEPVARLMIASGWSCSEVPFSFRVRSARPFLLQARRLHGSRIRSGVARALAHTRLGDVGLGVWSILQALRGRRPTARALDLGVESEWGPWADEIWERDRDQYAFVGERSRRVLDALYPSGGDPNPGFRRVRVRRDGRELGWAVTLSAQLTDHNHFGSLRLGSIVDAFGAPADADAVLSAALLDLESRCDLVVANFGHPDWAGACRRIGMLSAPTNFLLFLSKPLLGHLKRENAKVELAFVTRGDGDGPANLY